MSVANDRWAVRGGYLEAQLAAEQGQDNPPSGAFPVLHPSWDGEDTPGIMACWDYAANDEAAAIIAQQTAERDNTEETTPSARPIAGGTATGVGTATATLAKAGTNYDFDEQTIILWQIPPPELAFASEGQAASDAAAQDNEGYPPAPAVGDPPPPEILEEVAQTLELEWSAVAHEQAETEAIPVSGAAMPTVTDFFAATSDGYLRNADPTYSVARAGSGTPTSDVAGTDLIFGQQLSAGSYRVYEAFLNFDISAVGPGSISAALLSLYGTSDVSTTDFVIVAATDNWGATLTNADFVPGANLGALTELATFSTSPSWPTSQYNVLANTGTALRDAAIAALAGDGIVRIILFSSRTRDNTAPTTGEFVQASSADATGNYPKLTLTYTVPTPGDPPPPEIEETVAQTLEEEWSQWATDQANADNETIPVSGAFPVLEPSWEGVDIAPGTLESFQAFEDQYAADAAWQAAERDNVEETTPSARPIAGASASGSGSASATLATAGTNYDFAGETEGHEPAQIPPELAADTAIASAAEGEVIPVSGVRNDPPPPEILEEIAQTLELEWSHWAVDQANRDNESIPVSGAPPPAPPSSDYGLRVDVYAAGASPARLGLGPITQVLDFEYGNAVDRIGDAKLVLPATDPKVAYITDLAQLRVYRGGEGRVFVGRVREILTGQDAAGQATTEVTLDDLAVDLAIAKTGLGFTLTDVGPAGMLSALLAAANLTAPTTWADGSVDSSAITLRKRHDADDVWPAIIANAPVWSMHARHDSITNPAAPVVDLGAFGADSGLQFGIGQYPLQEIRKHQTGGALVNRIIGFGHGEGYPALSLKAASHGANLCTNPSFETDASGWTPANATIARSAAQAKLGSYSGLLTRTSSTTFFATATAAITGASTGRSWKLGTWIYGTGAMVGKALLIQINTTGGSSPTVGYASPTCVAGWQYVSAVVAAADANSTGITISIGSAVGVATAGDLMYLDRVTLWESTYYAYCVETDLNPDGSSRYWIEDVASSAAYGVREDYRTVKVAYPISATKASWIGACNQVYDLCAEWLQLHTAALSTYSAKVLGLNHVSGGSQVVKVGDKSRLFFHGIASDNA